MIFPPLSQVIGKSLISRKKRVVHNYPLTPSEILKVKSVLKNEKSIKLIDDETSFNSVLNQLDALFGEFKTTYKGKSTFRGKLEYKNKIKDPETGEEQVIFTLSDPKTLYRNINSEPIYLRVPYKQNLINGIYVEVDVYPNTKNDKYMFFTESENIRPLDFELKIPVLFLDYTKFNDIFKFEYGFDLSDTAQKYKHNLELSNIDLILLNKIAGENFHNEVKGGVNFNIIKTTHDQSTYNLEVLDQFLDKITFSQKTKTVFNTNLIRGGTITQFDTLLNSANRQISTTPFKNYYGLNIGFSLYKSPNIEKDKLMERLSKTCVDYINPIGNITTRTQSAVKRLINLDKEYMFSSRALLLETQLLSIKSKISDILDIEPKVLRMATMLKKFEGCINDMGTDEILPNIKINENSIDDANRFLKNNIEDVKEFIITK